MPKLKAQHEKNKPIKIIFSCFTELLTFIFSFLSYKFNTEISWTLVRVQTSVKAAHNT